jgi:hypothetical protein
MLAANYNTLVTYFKDFAEAQEAPFSYGDTERLVNLTTNTPAENYPVVHLEKPLWKPTDNEAGNLMIRFTGSVVALAKYSDEGDAEATDASKLAAETASFDLMVELVKQLNHDRNGNKFVLDLNTLSGEPVFEGWLNNHLGWKLYFHLDFYANNRLC